MLRDAANAVGDLKGVVSTGVRAVRTRLELLALEVKEEKAWAVRFILVALAAPYLLTFGLLLGILAGAVRPEETGRRSSRSAPRSSSWRAQAPRRVMGSEVEARIPLFDDHRGAEGRREWRELMRGTRTESRSCARSASSWCSPPSCSGRRCCAGWNACGRTDSPRVGLAAMAAGARRS